MSGLPEIPDDVNANNVRAFALGYLEQAFQNRSRAMELLVQAMTAGIESDRRVQSLSPTYSAPDEALLIDRSESIPDEVPS